MNLRVADRQAAGERHRRLEPGEEEQVQPREREHRQPRAEDALQHALDEEGRRDEAVRRTDELHDLDLVPPREHREPERVRDESEDRERGHEENAHGDHHLEQGEGPDAARSALR